MTRRRRGGRRRSIPKPGIGQWGPSTIAVVVCSLGTGAFWALGSTVGAVFCAVITLLNVLIHPIWKSRVVATTKKTRKPAADRPYVSRRQRKLRRQRAALQGKMRSGRVRITGNPGCGYRCRASRMPRTVCRCVCGGATHGELRRWVPGT